MTTTYDTTVLGDTPIAYYNFLELGGLTLYDQTTNNNHGTLSGGVTQHVPGVVTNDFDYAYSFDGASGKVVLPSTLFPVGTTAFSVEIIYCIYTPGNTGYNRMISTGFVSGATLGLELGVKEDGSYIFSNIGNGVASFGPHYGPPVQYGVWHHVVLTYDGTTAYLYFDGNSVAAAAGTGGNPIGNNPMQIGAGATGFSWWQGGIAKASFYTSALTASQVSVHYNAVYNIDGQTFYNLDQYLTNTAAVTIATADQTTMNSGGTGADTTITYKVGTVGTGYSELNAGGSTAAWPNLGAIPSPNGHGYLFDTIILENMQVQNNPTANITLSTSDGTLTGNLYFYIFVRSSGGAYTQETFGSITGQVITTTPQALSVTAALTFINFNVGDKLYFEFYFDITANGLGFTTSTLNMIVGNGTGTPDAYISGMVYGPNVIQDSLYLTSAASATLATAGQISIATGGAAANKNTVVDNHTTYGELTALGAGTGTWASSATLPNPTGNGWLWDVTSLEDRQMYFQSAGNNNIQLKTTAHTVTADMYARVFKRSSGGVYTLIAESVLTGKTINTTATDWSFPYTLIQEVQFVVGDKLYFDYWLDITATTCVANDAVVVTEYAAGGGNFVSSPGTINYFIYEDAVTFVDQLASLTSSFSYIATETFPNDSAGPPVDSIQLNTGPVTYVPWPLDFPNPLAYEHGGSWLVAGGTAALPPDDTGYTYIGVPYQKGPTQIAGAYATGDLLTMEGLEGIPNGDLIVVFTFLPYQPHPYVRFNLTSTIYAVDYGDGTIRLFNGLTQLAQSTWIQGTVQIKTFGILRIKWISVNGAQHQIMLGSIITTGSIGATIPVNTTMNFAQLAANASAYTPGANVPTLGSPTTIPAFSTKPGIDVSDAGSFALLVSQLTPSLWMELDDGVASGGYAHDVYGNISPALISGSITAVVSSAIASEHKYGYQFNTEASGNTIYLASGSHTALICTGTSWGLEFIIYPTVTVGGADYFSICGGEGGTGAGSRSPCALLYNGNGLQVGFGDTGNHWNQITQAACLTSGAWNHVMVWFDGTKLYLYTNGTLVTSAAFVGATPCSTPLNYIGCINGSTPSLTGIVDQVIFYNNQALSSTLALSHYNAMVTGGAYRGGSALWGGLPFDYPVLSPPQVNVHFQLNVPNAGYGNTYVGAPATPYVTKYMYAKVYDTSGNFLDVWRDAPNFGMTGGPTPKFVINAINAQITMTLPRRFDSFDEVGDPTGRGTIGFGNVVQFWMVDTGNYTGGKLIWQGRIDTYTPKMDDQDNETIDVVMTPFDAVLGDVQFLGTQNFGTAGNAGTYVDPVTMFNWPFGNTNAITSLPYTSPLTLDPANPASSGVTYMLQFHNQNISSFLEAVRAIAPNNWFWRTNMATKTVTFKLASTTPQHTFMIGQHIGQPQYTKDTTNLKNYIWVRGYGAVVATATGSDVATYGQRTWTIVESRIVDQTTANRYAASNLAQLDRIDYRSVLRIFDNRGDIFGQGYDIENLQVGDTCRVLDPLGSESLSYWDIAHFDIDSFDYYSPLLLDQTLIITAITYGFDYADVEVSSLQPSQDRFLVNLALEFELFSQM